MNLSYSVKVYKQYFNFAASHFLVFKNSRESLHGHNYKVMVKGNGDKLAGDMVFNFLDLKPIVRKVCDSLDHKLLLPKDNPWITMESEGDNLTVKTSDALFSFPKSDLLLLPVSNISAERLAIYISEEISKRLKDEYKFSFKTLEVEVEETTGQSAIYLREEQ